MTTEPEYNFLLNNQINSVVMLICDKLLVCHVELVGMHPHSLSCRALRVLL